MVDRAQLPAAIHAIGERLGLDYNINRKISTRRYIEEYQEIHRLEYDQLRNTNFSLNESKTKKSKVNDKKTILAKVKNPLKLNRKVRKTLYKLSPEDKSALTYSTFEKVHDLWKQYCDHVARDSDQLKLYKMDLHGSKLKCTACRNVTHVGHEGIVVQETQNTFVIITVTNKLITIPKKESIFEITCRDTRYTIQGANLLCSVQARSKSRYREKRSFSEV